MHADHEDVLTTFMNYGSVAAGRQLELIRRMRAASPVRSAVDDGASTRDLPATAPDSTLRPQAFSSTSLG